MGAFYLFSQKGIRNLMLGFVHMMISNPYRVKLICLFSIELIFIIFSIYTIGKNKILIRRIPVWLSVIAAFIRMVLIFKFYFHQ